MVNASPDLAGQHRPTEIHTYADHRIAMSFALAGLMIEGIKILDPSCVYVIAYIAPVSARGRR